MSATTGFNQISLNEIEARLNSCADAFAQLAALLHTINEKAPKHSDAAKLAALGWSVACDMENFAGVAAEQMQKGGVTK